MGGIFLLRDQDKLVKMTEAPWDSEAVPQGLFAGHPELLARDHVQGKEARVVDQRRQLHHAFVVCLRIRRAAGPAPREVKIAIRAVPKKFDLPPAGKLFERAT